MKRPLDRRTFLNNLGVTMGAAAAATAGPSIMPAFAQSSPPKGNIPSIPLKMGHMTFLTGPAAVLGDETTAFNRSGLVTTRLNIFDRS